ncbi:MAG: hypothetical protein WA802_17255 [Terracidiphilus sp.]
MFWQERTNHRENEQEASGENCDPVPDAEARIGTMPWRYDIIDAVHIGLDGKKESNLEEADQRKRLWKLPRKTHEEVANRKNTDRWRRSDATVDPGNLDPDKAGIAVEKKEQCPQRRRDIRLSIDPNSVPVTPEPIEIIEPKSAG